MRKTIQTTIIGGVFFLIPVVLIGFLLGEAFAASLKLVLALDKVLPISTVGGAFLLGLLSILLVLVVCYLAGLLSRLPAVSQRADALDNLLIQLVPGYTVAKNILSGVTGEEIDRALKVVEVAFDDQAVLAFEVERLEDGRVVVFLPGAPAAWSGSMAIITPDRVTSLSTKAHQVANVMRVMGYGTGALLSGTPPKPEHPTS